MSRLESASEKISAKQHVKTEFSREGGMRPSRTKSLDQSSSLTRTERRLSRFRSPATAWAVEAELTERTRKRRRSFPGGHADANSQVRSSGGSAHSPITSRDSNDDLSPSGRGRKKTPRLRKLIAYEGDQLVGLEHDEIFDQKTFCSPAWDEEPVDVEIRKRNLVNLSEYSSRDMGISEGHLVDRDELIALETECWKRVDPRGYFYDAYLHSVGMPLDQWRFGMMRLGGLFPQNGWQFRWSDNTDFSQDVVEVEGRFNGGLATGRFVSHTTRAFGEHKQTLQPSLLKAAEREDICERAKKVAHFDVWSKIRIKFRGNRIFEFFHTSEIVDKTGGTAILFCKVPQANVIQFQEWCGVAYWNAANDPKSFFQRYKKQAMRHALRRKSKVYRPQLKDLKEHTQYI